MQYLTETAFFGTAVAHRNLRCSTATRGPPPRSGTRHAAPNLIRAMMDFTAQIYVVPSQPMASYFSDGAY